jgi:hypothetical protein
MAVQELSQSMPDSEQGRSKLCEEKCTVNGNKASMFLVVERKPRRGIYLTRGEGNGDAAS